MTVGPVSMEPITIEVCGYPITFDPANVTILPTEHEGDRLIAATEYAERHGVSAATVRRWLNDGRIEGDRLMGRWYVNEDAEPPEPTAYGRPRGSHVNRTRKVEKRPFRPTC